MNAPQTTVVPRHIPPWFRFTVGMRLVYLPRPPWYVRLWRAFRGREPEPVFTVVAVSDANTITLDPAVIPGHRFAIVDVPEES